MSLHEAISELIPFLSPGTRADIRSVAAEQILGLAASKEGQDLIKSRQDAIITLIKLSSDPIIAIRRAAIESIVNLGTDEELALQLLSLDDSSLAASLLKALFEEVDGTEAACMALSNLSRSLDCCKRVCETVSEEKLNDLVALVCKDKTSFHHLGLVLCNLSQHDAVRRALVDREKKLIKQLLNLVSYPKSTIRRKGVVGTIRNCCFDVENHEWLLSEDVDILPTLALPLAGPEEFDDDVNDKLPLDLQFLGERKQREEDPEIRKMLIEAITQLCSTKKGRLHIKDKQIYYIMREFHKWEKSKEVIFALENLVDILIGDEPEPGMENLHEIDVPQDLQEKFNKMDASLLNADDE